MNDKDFAIIIGINDYNSGDLDSLTGAINDAESIYNWLSDPNKGKIPSKNIKKIISSINTSDRPTQDHIDEAFLDIETAIKNIGGEARRFYFYFSGHGFTNDQNDTWLCLKKWSKRRANTCLSVEKYKKQIANYGYFKELIFILDCCRSKIGKIEPLGPTFGTGYQSKKTGDIKFCIINATRFQYAALEAEYETNVYQGVLTGALIEILNEPKQPNLGDIQDYLEFRVPQIVKEINGLQQKVDIDTKNIRENDFIFS